SEAGSAFRLPASGRQSDRLPAAAAAAPAAAATAAPAAAAAAVTAAAAAVTATATAAAAAAVFTRAGFVDGQVAAPHFLPVQRGDRRLHLAVFHVHEAKALRPAVVVRHQAHAGAAVRREQFLQVLLGGVEGQVAHVESLAHLSFLP